MTGSEKRTRHSWGACFYMMADFERILILPMNKADVLPSPQNSTEKTYKFNIIEYKSKIHILLQN